jgi:hypothetical protein
MAALGWSAVPTRSAWTAWWLFGLAAAGAWLVLRAWTPEGDPAHAVCALRRIAHVGCATCGLTRALGALARGDLGAALAFHPMALVLAGELAVAWGAAGLALARRTRILDQRWIPWAFAANATAFLLVWVARLVTGTIPV